MKRANQDARRERFDDTPADRAARAAAEEIARDLEAALAAFDTPADRAGRAAALEARS